MCSVIRRPRPCKLIMATAPNILTCMLYWSPVPCGFIDSVSRANPLLHWHCVQSGRFMCLIHLLVYLTRAPCLTGAFHTELLTWAGAPASGDESCGATTQNWQDGQKRLTHYRPSRVWFLFFYIKKRGSEQLIELYKPFMYLCSRPKEVSGQNPPHSEGLEKERAKQMSHTY